MPTGKTEYWFAQIDNDFGHVIQGVTQTPNRVPTISNQHWAIEYATLVKLEWFVEIFEAHEPHSCSTKDFYRCKNAERFVENEKKKNATQ